MRRGFWKTAKTISFRNAFTLAPPVRDKTDLFHPFCRRLGISEAKFGENSAKNKKKSRVEAVKRAELRFSRNLTVHSGGTPFRKQKKCRQNAAASENRVCASFVRPFAPLSASRPPNPMRIALCLLRHRMSSDTVSADELLINHWKTHRKAVSHIILAHIIFARQRQILSKTAVIFLRRRFWLLTIHHARTLQQNHSDKNLIKVSVCLDGRQNMPPSYAHILTTP